MENPNLPLENTTTDGWTQHIIDDGGTDVHFRMANLTVNGTLRECLISAEFFNERLMLYCSGNGNWSDWSQVAELTIDSTVGQTFDVYYHDFNQDGRPDIMISAYNHSRGHVFVYETPADVATSNFTKHTIADGFIANLIIGGQSMTPGSPKVNFAPMYFIILRNIMVMIISLLHVLHLFCSHFIQPRHMKIQFYPVDGIAKLKLKVQLV